MAEKKVRYHTYWADPENGEVHYIASATEAQANKLETQLEARNYEVLGVVGGPGGMVEESALPPKLKAPKPEAKMAELSGETNTQGTCVGGAPQEEAPAAKKSGPRVKRAKSE
jgi:hypothetical protein